MYAQILQGKLSASIYQTAKSKITKATNVAKENLRASKICESNIHVRPCNSTRPPLDSHSSCPVGAKHLVWTRIHNSYKIQQAQRAANSECMLHAQTFQWAYAIGGWSLQARKTWQLRMKLWVTWHQQHSRQPTRMQQAQRSQGNGAAHCA